MTGQAGGQPAASGPKTAETALTPGKTLQEPGLVFPLSGSLAAAAAAGSSLGMLVPDDGEEAPALSQPRQRSHWQPAQQTAAASGASIQPSKCAGASVREPGVDEAAPSVPEHWAADATTAQGSRPEAGVQQRAVIFVGEHVTALR